MSSQELSMRLGAHRARGMIRTGHNGYNEKGMRRHVSTDFLGQGNPRASIMELYHKLEAFLD